MPVDTREIIDLLSKLAEEENLRVTITEALKGTFLAGAGAFVGTVCGGPAGMAVGATVGGAIGALTCKDFKPVPEILVEMDEEKKIALAENLRRIMESINITDVAMLAVLLAGDLSLKNKVIYTLVDFFKNELSLVIADH